MELLIGNKKLTLEDLINVTRNGYEVKISEEAKEKVSIARKLVDDYVEEGKISYGITTGFGKFSDSIISKEETATLQRNLIISHACGVGNPLPVDQVRGIMLLRVNNLVQGHSGVRQKVLDLLVEMINKGVTPYIPEKGSLGASGDLAPLSHMVLVMLGLGKAYYKGELYEGEEALKKAKIKPIKTLSSKEGLEHKL